MSGAVVVTSGNANGLTGEIMMVTGSQQTAVEP